MATIKTETEIEFSTQGLPLPRRAHWAKRERRIVAIYRYLLNKNDWISTQEISKKFPIAKRTLRATLNSMVKEGLIRGAISLEDSRTRLYKAVSN